MRKFSEFPKDMTYNQGKRRSFGTQSIYISNARFLEHVMNIPTGFGVLLVEDDVVLPRGWYNRFQNAILSAPISFDVLRFSHYCRTAGTKLNTCWATSGNGTRCGGAQAVMYNSGPIESNHRLLRMFRTTPVDHVDFVIHSKPDVLRSYVTISNCNIGKHVFFRGSLRIKFGDR